MGGCLSIPWAPVNHVSQWLWSEGGYVRNLQGNLESLENAIEMLKAKRDDVQRRVDREESTRNQRRLVQVQVWLTNVLKIENQFDDLIRASELESQRLCLGGFCSQNFIESNIYGKRVSKMLRDVEILSSQGVFHVVAEIVGPLVEEMPIPPIIFGQETMLETVWNRLMDDEVGILGLYGMGGVGKTTLLTQINNKFTEVVSKFHIVIWVVVSNGTSIYKIQSDIGEKLDLKGEGWNKKSENQRALDIHKVLIKKKFVLLLDDIWEKVILKTVGVPHPNKKNESKIVFTTRSLDVCGRMGVQHPIKVTSLDPENAWGLFQDKVGVATLESHPSICILARLVAEKCHGLPLTLNVIGETMAFKNTVQEWYDAINGLTSCATNFPDIETNVLPILKYSDDYLRWEQLKSCFLYCSFFSKDYEIEKEKLIDCWICEGFIDENEGRETALKKGYEILGTLICAGLLLDREVRTFSIQTVSMHDVSREMALKITTDYGKKKDQYIVQARVGLREMPKVKNSKDVRKMSLMENDIKKITGNFDCPQLTTLFLQKNKKLVNISGEFFRSLSSLLVLDLSSNENLTELPEDISYLVSLKYLDLSSTNIKRLPFGLQKLRMLTHLNLERTWSLESLHEISKLSSLRTLRLKTHKRMLDISLMRELEFLEHLECLTIDIPQSLLEEQLSYDSRIWRCIQDVDIRHLQDNSLTTLVLPTTMTNLRYVFIMSAGTLEIKIEKTSCYKSLSSPCFSNLHAVSINNCYDLKDLTWLLFAPNLTQLVVSHIIEMEYIIDKEKAASFLEKEESCKIIPFRKLERLVLDCLLGLWSIYWTSLPFPCLRKLIIVDCDGLGKLPLDSQSVEKIEDFTIEYNDEKWKERIKWEDEATKLRFLPSFVPK